MRLAFNALALLYCVYMLSVSIVDDSAWSMLYAPLVFVLGGRVCRATNWMDEEGEE